MWYEIPEAEIESENQKNTSKPPKYENQNEYPYYHLGSDRDFERLLYCIYKNPAKMAESNYFYDETILMQGTGEKGRDIWLKKSGKSVGLIQCKKYKSAITKPNLIGEVTKFILYSKENQELIDLESNKKFNYHIAVSHDISEPGKNFISDVNNSIFDENDLRSGIDKAIKEYKSIKEKETSENALEYVKLVIKSIKITPIYPTDIDLTLKNDKFKDIVSLFFKVDLVTNIVPFEELLIRRNQEEIKFKSELSTIEAKLRSKNELLFSKLQEIKTKAQKLYNEHSLNCLEYSDHNKNHHKILIDILSDTVIGNELMEELNEHELFIASTCCYLSDIGICKEHEKLLNNISISELLPHEKLNEKIREKHPTFNKESLRDFFINIDVSDKYIEAIQNILAVNSNHIEEIANIHKLDWHYKIKNTDRKDVRLPLLSLVLSISEILDIENSNSEKILKNYINFTDFILAKVEWEEFNKNVSFTPSDDGQKITFYGTVNNQLLYLGISEHIAYLSKVLSHGDKILRQQGKNSLLDIKIIENNIASPYSNNFGFSLDFENILSKFLGKKIYKDEFSSIREAIQNAIDACTIRQNTDKNYSNPTINIKLHDNKLIISDNGIGMDRFIFKEYFSKIGRSYAMDHNIENSIGRFGIGVYSYFMICDTFEVNTKNIHGNGVHASLSCNSPNGFYFHKDNQESTGTKITFHLDKKFDINEYDLIEYIKYYFKHSHIPIFFESTTISHKNYDFHDSETPHETKYITHKAQILINSNHTFHKSKEDTIKEHIKLPFREDFSKYNFYSITHESNSADGCIGVFIPKNPVDLNNFNREDFDLTRKYDSGIKLFQQGVYIKHASNFIGEVNIKNPLPLKLDRNDFENNNDILPILDDFECKIIEEIKVKTADMHSSLFSQFFLFNFKSPFFSEKKLSILENFIVIDVAAYYKAGESLSEPKVNYMYLKEIGELNEILIILRENIPISHEDLLEELKNHHIPVISASGYSDYNTIKEYLKKHNFGLKIKNSHSRSLLYANKNIKEVKANLKPRQAKIIEFTDDQSICTICPNLGNSEYINSRNLIIIEIENNIDIYKSDSKFKKSIDTFIESLMDIIRNTYPFTLGVNDSGRRIELWKLNPLLEPINKRLNKSLRLTIENFPTWMHDKIDSER
ncbi:ATP-binding protein [Thiothrix unzii]|jgi:HSP90 family molecular chaperone|uniref:HD domain-containing protein n=1 Tax=Thiothrix unzii TaxID=111769 RepID=UPI002A36758B|nr:ATP-binding protein [Thiothrix unzii]MDX9989063.1 ATP-binding protein [Thiothrix unzii]